jgi:hypothetical protein
VSVGSITDTSWHYVVGSSDGSQLRVFIDDQSVNYDDKTGTTRYDSQNLLIGVGVWSGNPVDYFDGNIDEVRISNIKRDTCWIKTTFNTINDPGSFYSVQGTPDNPAPTGIELNSFTATGEGSAVQLQWRRKQRLTTWDSTFTEHGETAPTPNPTAPSFRVS